MATTTSFADFVKESRERKKNEALAQEILGSRGRKAKASGAGVANGRANAQKPSLLSRTSGIQKPRSSSAKPASSIDGKWQHDLHGLNNPAGAASKRLNRTASASQISRNTRAFDKFSSTLSRNADEEVGQFNIRGVAARGPWVVIASNFAPGTTAADVEAVFQGSASGSIESCRLITSSPTVMVETVFASKEHAENVINTYNNKKADGRVLYVYMKDGGKAPVAPSRGPRGGALSYDDMDIDTNGGARSGSFQDGRFGFNENGRRDPPRGPRRRY